MSRRTRRLSSSGDCLLTENTENEATTTTENQQRKRMRLSTSRRSISNRRSTNFDLQIGQIYTDCIKLGSKNVCTTIFCEDKALTQ